MAHDVCGCSYWMDCRHRRFHLVLKMRRRRLTAAGAVAMWNEDISFLSLSLSLSRSHFPSFTTGEGEGFVNGDAA